MAVEQEVTYYDDYVVVSEVVERGVKKVTKRGTCTVTDKDVQWGGGAIAVAHIESVRPLSYSPSPDQRARANWLTGSSLVLLFGSFVVFQMFGWLSAPAFLLQEYALVSGVLFLGIGLFAGWGRKSNTINVVEVTMSSGKVHTLVFQDLQTAWDVAQAIGLAIAGRSPYPRISVTQTGSPEA